MTPTTAAAAPFRRLVVFASLSSKGPRALSLASPAPRPRPAT